MSGECPFAPTSAEDKQLPKYTWEEIKEHSHSKSLWVVVHDNVYDVTKFLEEVSSFCLYISTYYSRTRDPSTQEAKKCCWNKRVGSLGSL